MGAGAEIGFLIIIGAVVAILFSNTPLEYHEYQKESMWGSVNSAMICPHCQTKGSVRTKQTTQKAGISGGKATAAILTGGLSLLAMGLSRKEQRTQAHCGNC